MKIRDWEYIYFFAHLLAAGLLAGSFCTKNKKFKSLQTDYGLLRQENIYLKKSRRKMLRQHQHLRSMRHEMENDQILEMSYLDQKQYGQLKEHYLKKTEYLKSNDPLVHTGHIGMDAILNYKSEKAQKDQIRLNVQHQLWFHVTIDNRDLNMILGNLLDNAIEAVRQLAPKDRVISMHIAANATAFFLEISNQYLQNPLKDHNGNYRTQKALPYLHGQGLLRVKRIAGKYGGDVAVRDTDHCFNVKVLLYMPE